MAGQYGKVALRQHDTTNFRWVCKVYDLDGIPVTVLFELGGHPITVAHVAITGEIVRDMYSGSGPSVRHAYSTTIFRAGKTTNLDRIPRCKQAGQLSCLTTLVLL